MNQNNALVTLRQTLTSGAVVQSIKEAVPQTLAKYLTPERITRMVVSSASRNPQLLQCTPISVAKAVADACRLGLEPCSPLGEAYLVPYRNNKIQGAPMEAQFIPGYRGYISLARRSGQIKSVTANLVHERDAFEIDLASGERPRHKPCLDPAGRGEIVAAYCIADFVDGGHHLDLMTISDILAIRDRSRASKSGPWVTDFGEMARKTVVRRAAKYWPLSIELADALEQDNRVDSGDVYDAQLDDESSIAPPRKARKTDAVLAAIADAPDETPGDLPTHEQVMERQLAAHERAVAGGMAPADWKKHVAVATGGVEPRTWDDLDRIDMYVNEQWQDGAA